MQRTITSFYEFCFLLSVNKRNYYDGFKNSEIVHYFYNYSIKDIENLNNLIYKDFDTYIGYNDYFNHYINIWRLIKEKNIKAVSCCYNNNYKIFYGLCYRYYNKIYMSNYYFEQEACNLRDKVTNNQVIIIQPKPKDIFNINDYEFLTKIRKDMNLI